MRLRVASALFCLSPRANYPKRDPERAKRQEAALVLGFAAKEKSPSAKNVNYHVKSHALAFSSTQALASLLRLRLFLGLWPLFVVALALVLLG